MFTREDKLKEITREIALRKNVYPSRVASHKIMLEIAEDYGGRGLPVAIIEDFEICTDCPPINYPTDPAKRRGRL